ncbi:hypothetical protein S7335_5447 [Synechococcus sp. PCC 7335]|uniref:hypothetical protein n=1 Tax=Synechococcus sp. (strain ATCC 29403 / PCC 7335) TaxID=91464 RepID=UPI00017EE762|nr:hypothetical protein [Synechococcus sp. PCC 7335]EDX87737.1 hypothetical protein S7335_5447 [Synechococcus sp. PCC 7335]
MLPPQRSQLQKLRLYLHLIPIFGVVLSLWSLYGKSTLAVEELEGATEKATEKAFAAASVKSVSRLSVILGLGCVGAIACLGIGAHSQTSQTNHLRLLLMSSFVGSSYFLLSLALMIRVAKDQSLRLPGISQLSRRLP